MHRDSSRYKVGEKAFTPSGGPFKISNKNFVHRRSEWKYSFFGLMETYYESELQDTSVSEYKGK